MTTLEDKILGEKAHCYCSSSESEDDKSDDEGNAKEESAKCQQTTSSVNLPPQPNPYKWEGSSTNTGPKGVVKDWQIFKQQEAKMREEQERERLELIKKLSLTCRSALDEERDKAQEDPELAELMSDDFLFQYQKERMKEMIAEASALPKFGKLFNLKDGKEFLDAVDKVHKNVTVIVHIYEENIPACEAMNGSLITLCKEYSQVKFCKLIGSVAGVSKQFKVNGVPALLAYKAGSLVGNFVSLSDELGNDFYAEDVESYLLEHGMLPDKSFLPSIIRSQDDDADDSDLSLE